jgi:hypothetical protein
MNTIYIYQSSITTANLSINKYKIPQPIESFRSVSDNESTNTRIMTLGKNLIFDIDPNRQSKRLNISSINERCEPCEETTPTPTPTETTPTPTPPCCTPPPEDFTYFDDLCVEVTLTDFEGNTQTLVKDDAIPVGSATLLFSEDFPNVSFSVLLSFTGEIDVNTGCWQGMVNANIGGAGQFSCPCTSVFGMGQLPCSNDEKWYLGTFSGQMSFEDVGGCEDCLQQGLAGTFSVTISEPPC